MKASLAGRKPQEIVLKLGETNSRQIGIYIQGIRIVSDGEIRPTPAAKKRRYILPEIKPE